MLHCGERRGGLAEGLIWCSRERSWAPTGHLCHPMSCSFSVSSMIFSKALDTLTGVPFASDSLRPQVRRALRCGTQTQGGAPRGSPCSACNLGECCASGGCSNRLALGLPGSAAFCFANAGEAISPPPPASFGKSSVAGWRTCAVFQAEHTWEQVTQKARMRNSVMSVTPACLIFFGGGTFFIGPYTGPGRAAAASRRQRCDKRCVAGFTGQSLLPVPQIPSQAGLSSSQDCR